jgi:hypothetical protein
MPQIAEVHCPACRAMLDGATVVGGYEPVRPPQPGDATVCCYCSALLVFDGPPLVLRYPTPAERVELLAKYQIGKVQEVTQVWRDRLGRPTRPRSH